MSADRKRPEQMKATSLLWIGLGAVLLAFLAAMLLSPAGSPDPPPVESAKYFDSGQQARSDDYRSDRRLLAVVSLVIQFSLLSFLALYRGRPLKNILERLGRRPYAGAAIAGASISLLLTIVLLPLDLMAFDRGREFGLITQGIGPWFTDLLVSTMITCLLAATGATLAMLLWRRFKRRFWLAGSVLVAAWAVLSVWLWPVAVAPLFNDFEPLPPGKVRTEVIQLADRAGVDVGEVYEVDASRRSSTLNAYVNGIGSSKRVVIYDNAINDLNDQELSALIAHELGHVESNDLYRGLGFAILVIPLGVLFVQVGTMTLIRRRGDDPAGPAIVPALALMVAVATLVLSVPGNMLSRNIETRADRFSFELTGESSGMIGLQEKLAESNLTDPDPPGIYQFLFGTHPATLERIAAAEQFRTRDAE